MNPYNATYQVRGSATFDIDYKTNALRGRVLDAEHERAAGERHRAVAHRHAERRAAHGARRPDRRHRRVHPRFGAARQLHR